MSKRADQLLQDTLENAWTATSNPSAGSSCTATKAGVVGARQFIQTVVASITNLTAAAVTNNLTIRHGNQTVIGQIAITVAANATQTFNAPLQWPGKMDLGVSADISGANASVTQKATIAGWTDQRP